MSLNKGYTPADVGDKSQPSVSGITDMTRLPLAIWKVYFNIQRCEIRNRKHKNGIKYLTIELPSHWTDSTSSS